VQRKRTFAFGLRQQHHAGCAQPGRLAANYARVLTADDTLKHLARLHTRNV
jgi:hypothetical protein